MRLDFVGYHSIAMRMPSVRMYLDDRMVKGESQDHRGSSRCCSLHHSIKALRMSQ